LAHFPSRLIRTAGEIHAILYAGHTATCADEETQETKDLELDDTKNFSLNFHRT